MLYETPTMRAIWDLGWNWLKEMLGLQLIVCIVVRLLVMFFIGCEGMSGREEEREDGDRRSVMGEDLSG